MNIEKKDEFTSMVSKVVGGLLIAAISGSIAWSISIGSRVAVLETNQLNSYQDIVQTQDRVENISHKLISIDKAIMGIFTELKDIQREQLELSKVLSDRMDKLEDSVEESLDSK